MKKSNKKYFCIVIGATIALLLNACALKNPQGNDVSGSIESALNQSITSNQALSIADKNRSNLPSSLQNALMPDLSIPNVGTGKAAGNNENEQHFDISVNSVPAKDFFMGLVKDTKHNITVDPKVGGEVSLDLKDVSIPQAMEAVRNIYGFEYEKTSYGYQVYARRLETRVFHVNYLNIDRSGQSQTAIGSGPISSTTRDVVTSSGIKTSNQSGSMPSGTISTSSNSSFWSLLKENLFAIIEAANSSKEKSDTKNERSVVINADSGSIIVTAYPDELRHIAKYLDSIQEIIQRQVIIEAKIIEVTLNAGFRTGINWKALGVHQGFGFDTTSIDENDLQLTTGILTATASADRGNFRAALRMLGSQGSVNVLSSPRISTLNNQKAVIKVGGDQFFVTGVTSNVNNSGTTTSDSTSNSITLTPFFSGISLDVTPQIDEDGSIFIHIHPIISKVTKDIMKLNAYGNTKEQELPLAKSTVRESDSIVRAKNGQVIVIGGLMSSESENDQQATPGAEQIPGVGELFKNRDKKSAKTELVILLRPVVVGGTETWQKELRDTAQRFKNMNKQADDFNYKIVPADKK